MKPNINLANPIVKKAINEYQKIMIEALEIPQDVEKAVLPIYFPPKLNKKPIQIASGVLVCIKNEYLIFSASHVFDSIGNYQLLTGDSAGNLILSIEGERFSTGKGKSGTLTDDPIDASVFQIKSFIPDSLKDLAITIQEFDLSPSHIDKNSVYIAAGFRSKKSNTSGNVIKSKREGWPSIEISDDEYIRNKMDANYSIALRYENQILLNGIWQTSPTPKGFSGGAIIRLDGMNILNEETTKSDKKQLLSGIIIEQRRGKGNEKGILIGTRIDVHLTLIKHFLPELLDDSY